MIPKITFVNICKPIYGVIITPVTSDPSNLENVKRKGKSYINFNISKTKRAF